MVILINRGPFGYSRLLVTGLFACCLTCLVAHPQLLCSGSRDNSVCLWDLEVGKPVSSMHAPRNVVTDLKWIPRETAVLQASEDKTLRVWDLTTCSTVQHFRARNSLQVSLLILRLKLPNHRFEVT